MSIAIRQRETGVRLFHLDTLQKRMERRRKIMLGRNRKKTIGHAFLGKETPPAPKRSEPGKHSGAIGKVRAFLGKVRAFLGKMLRRAPK